METRLSLRKRS
ncbi:hypothetical protein CBU_1376a [Coxiella burnetii RSA 493]|uniref:Uncharacterized protein n=1 Tax=Coxiella burnetii (strain RSA 493 / Nine Mile phase I) TaxID=227377 RepID=B5QSC7_COXBU|nr:hypothetical protein CBU_1376a [Coxiella burnetii RSA 493]ACJ18042.1 hypothetical protein CbuG_0634 [Coxiella burnetii CbuG_Q212]BBL36612.1 hypothetical protein CBU406_C06090 [Coxiella burnetii]BBL39058.1 hypothetical protein CBUVS42_C13210 [Coxiella burnetii]